MIDQIKQYFSDIYFDEIGMKVIPILLSSIILRGLMKRFPDIDERFRLRLNVLLFWERGWYKTAILKHVMRVSSHEIKINLLSQGSASALRGSFSEKKFIPPEFLISDVICALELAPLIGFDTENINILLTALEEGDVRVSLIKIPNDAEAREEVEDYGAHLEDHRLSYRNRSVAFFATHTLDGVIPPMHRDAFLDRFMMCHIPPEKIERLKMFENWMEKIDVEFESRVRVWISDCIRNADRPNIAENLNWLREYFPRSIVKTPRQLSDVTRLMIADKIMYPDSTNSERVRRMVVLLSNSGNYFPTPREMIADAIYNNPMTLPQLEVLTGTSKANVLGHCNRLKAEKLIDKIVSGRGRSKTIIKYVIRGEPDNECEE